VARRELLLLGRVAVEPELDLGVTGDADVPLRGGDDLRLARGGRGGRRLEVDLDDEGVARDREIDVLHDDAPSFALR